MELAMSEAIKAKAKQEVPVGAIIVDKNGNMVAGQGAHACSADCFKVNQGGMANWYTYINGNSSIDNNNMN